MKIFKNREAAGKLLADRLRKYKAKVNTLVLGIPRGGIVVAYQVAKKLKLPLDVIVTRKIGHPNQPELAIGAVDADGKIAWQENFIKESIKDPAGLVSKQVQEIKRRNNLYRQGKKQLLLKNKTIILVDDGIATGATVLSAINYLKRHQAKKVILAVPVASRESAFDLSKQTDELIILEIPSDFQAVGQFYHQFDSVKDEEVIQYLKTWMNNC